MSTSTELATRRRVLRGMMGGAAVSVGLPLLDCFLDSTGRAFAGGAPLPVCFGTWFQGLGLNPGSWEPKTTGAGYEMMPHLGLLAPLKSKINIFSGLRAYVSGAVPVHVPGHSVGLGGAMPKPGVAPGPSLDSIIADTIGSRTRFRSLEVSCDGTPTSYSTRGGNARNPGEHLPIALYTRIFGPEFTDPNAASFTPDPEVMVRKSALSAVSDERADLAKKLGAADRTRLDEFFTSLRATENQLNLQLQRPAPLESCVVPRKPEEQPTGRLIHEALAANKAFAALLTYALACGQTQVINVNFAGTASTLRKPGSTDVYHIYTHEEAVDPALGYQPTVTWFQSRVIEALHEFISALDSFKEGDGTLLDRSLVLYTTDHGYARYHTAENIPMITAGSAGGRVKTGIHIAAPGDSMTRVGLTLQQALGVPVSSWGKDQNATSRTMTEILA